MNTDSFEVEHIQHHLHAALAAVGDSDRSIVLMRHIEGLEVSGIAQALGLSEGAARKRLERAMQIARTLGRVTRDDAPDGALDMMLEIGDSVMTHRRQYTMRSGRRTVIDLLALDPLNPRSILFQLERLKEEIGLLPGVGRGGTLSGAGKEILRLHTSLAIREAPDLDPATLNALGNEIAGLYTILAKAYFA